LTAGEAKKKLPVVLKDTPDGAEKSRTALKREKEC
jgi:hypothetical protein